MKLIFQTYFIIPQAAAVSNPAVHNFWRFPDSLKTKKQKMAELAIFAIKNFAIITARNGCFCRRARFPPPA